jgi:hypothetical protein
MEKLEKDEFCGILELLPLKFKKKRSGEIAIYSLSGVALRYDIEKERCDSDLEKVAFKKKFGVREDPGLAGARKALMDTSTKISPADFIVKLSSILINGEIYEPSKGEIKTIGASSTNNYKCIQELMQSGFTADAKLTNGIYALHVAAKKGNKEAANVLVKNGASINKECSSGITPLEYAYSNSNYGVKRALIKNGADLNIDMGDGVRPIHLSAREGSLKMLKLLLSRGANVERTDDGISSIAFAVYGFDEDFYTDQKIMCKKVNLLCKEGSSLSREMINEERWMLDTIMENCEGIPKEQVTSDEVGSGCL